jgi:hypothetical protein
VRERRRRRDWGSKVVDWDDDLKTDPRLRCAATRQQRKALPR